MRQRKEEKIQMIDGLWTARRKSKEDRKKQMCIFESMRREFGIERP